MMKARRLLGMSALGGLVMIVMAAVALEAQSQTSPSNDDCVWALPTGSLACKQEPTAYCVGCGAPCNSGQVYTQNEIYSDASPTGGSKLSTENVECYT